MLQGELELKNQEHQEAFVDVLRDIDDGVIYDDEYIIQDLEKVLNEMNIDDKDSALRFLHIKYNKRSFLQDEYFEIQLEENSQSAMDGKLNIQEEKIDFNKLYKDLKEKKMGQKLIKMIKNEEFRQKNLISNKFFENIELISRLDDKLFDLLTIMEDQNSEIKIHKLELLRILVFFIYHQMDCEEDQNNIEIIIGSLLLSQIDEFLFYIGTIKNENQKQFTEFLIYLKENKLKISSQNQTSENLLQNKDLKFLTSLFSANADQIRKNLDKKLIHILQIQEDHLTLEIIENQISFCFSNQISMQECYFQVVWYLWAKYIYQKEFLAELLKNEGMMDKILDEQKRITFWQRFSLKLKKQKVDDQIYHFFIDCTILSTISDNQSQTYQQFREKQEALYKEFEQQSNNVSSFQDLITLNENQFLKLWTTVNNLPFLNKTLNQFQESHLHSIMHFFWRFQPDSGTQMFLKIVAQVKSFSLFQFSELILHFFQKQSKSFIASLLRVTSIQKNYPVTSVQILISYFLLTHSFEGGEILIKFNEYLRKEKLSSEDLKFLSLLTAENWEAINRNFENTSLTCFALQILDSQIGEISKKKYHFHFLVFFKKFLQNFMIINQCKLQCFKILVENLDLLFLQNLLVDNKKDSTPDIKIVEITVNSLLELYDKQKYYDKTKINQKIVTATFLSLIHFIRPEFYHLKVLMQLKQRQTRNEIILKIVKVYYFQQFNRPELLLAVCEDIFSSDEEIYKITFADCNYLKNFQLTPVILKQSQLKKKFSQFHKVTLEQFNFSLSIIEKVEQEKLVADWMNYTRDEAKFLNLMPLFFDIFKRGENPGQLLTLINSLKPINTQQNFNIKSLFQIFYNNCNHELQSVLLKFRCQAHPVPFIYRNLANQIDVEEDLYVLNHQLFYIFPQCYTVINFSLSNTNNQIGKTQLINDIFYEEPDLFQTSDTSEINKNTIDIMFDYSFNGSRELAIADAHGKFPLSILLRILPLFQLWVIQLDSEVQLADNITQLQQFKELIEDQKPQICFIVRNSKQEYQDAFKDVIEEIKNNNIEILYMQNLTETNLDKQIKTREIDAASYFLLKQIDILVKNGEKKKSIDFKKILLTFDERSQIHAKQLQKEEKILEDIEQELLRFVNEPEGFYNEKAFPKRSHNKKKKDKRQIQINSSQKNMENNQQKLIQKQNADDDQKQNLTLLDLYCEIFQQPNFYILYLQFVERLRKFNSQHTKDLEDKIEQIQKEKGDSLKQQISEVESEIKSKYISIEIFWREIIHQQQCGNEHSIKINPAKIIAQLIRKGEPFEFLDGDNLKINNQFLSTMIKNLKQEGMEKILVLGILGPQSTGKSTILNKIFGCHLWTSAGRCTKGIYIQLIKIKNNQTFADQFEYILLFDTEGLQNPQQKSPEFDKKIALFILLICDIIILNVKGEVTQNFRSLVEMCIYTHEEMTENFSFTKLLSWCFNQNSQTNDYNPFLKQIEEISQNLNQELYQGNGNFQKKEMTEFFQITQDNIQVLGVSQVNKRWKNAEKSQYYNKSYQLTIIDSYTSDAFKYGIKAIDNFIHKWIQQKNDQPLHNFAKFISTVEANWQKIEKLPDLLEFSDLKSHLDNKKMKDYYENITKNFDFQFMNTIPKSIEEQIQEQIRKNNVQKFDVSEILYYQKTNIEKLKQILKTAQENLQHKKMAQDITGKIVKKYDDMLEQFIKIQENQFQSMVREYIQDKQRIFSKQQGINQINQFIKDAYKNKNRLQQFQKFPNSIKTEFDRLWADIVKQQKQEQERLFQDFQKAQLNLITQTYIQYIIKSNQQETIIELLQQNNKSNPQAEDLSQFFSIYKKELNVQQFKLVDKSQAEYYPKFTKSIGERLRESEKHLIPLKNHYKYKLQFQYFQNQTIRDYFKYKLFFKDLITFILNENSELKKLIYDFFTIFQVFNIEYQPQDFKKLLEKIKDSKQKNEAKVTSELESTFIQFQSKLKFNLEHNQPINNENLLYSFSIFYPNLRYDQKSEEVNTYKEYEEIKRNLLKIGVIKHEITNIVQKDENEQIYDYIKNPLETEEDQTFLLKIQDFFTKIIEQQDGWKYIYQDIFNLILNETDKLNASNIQEKRGAQKNDSSFIFSDSSIGNIMKLINDKIQDYNYQFVNFGVILNSVAERTIQYFSILMIWRIGCSKKWQIYQKHDQELQNSYPDQLRKLETEILKDKENQSNTKAERFYKSIFSDFEKSIYDNIQVVAEEIIKSKQLSCENLIWYLDSEILQQKSDQLQKNIQNVMEYMMDQQKYIATYVEEYIQNIKQEIQQFVDANENFKIQFVDLLNKLKSNAEKIKASFQELKYQQYTKNYFDLKVQKEDSFYEQQLYIQVIGALTASKSNCEAQLNQTYEKILQGKFQSITTKFFNREIMVNIFDYTENKSDKEIQELKKFLETLIQLTQSQIDNIDKYTIDIAKLILDGPLYELRKMMNGCQYSCPNCNRKCDQPNKPHQQHQCSNGHQLRGMNKIIIGSVPSLLTCEEMDDKFQIIDSSTNTLKNWIDIKKENSNWLFKLKEQINQINLQKMKGAWNNGVGKLTCEFLSHHFLKQIYYIKAIMNSAEEIHHYIFMIDSSKEMRGDRWNKAEKNFEECMEQLQKTKSVASVITFDDEAKIYREIVKPQKAKAGWSWVWNCSGSTNLDNALMLAFQMFQRNNRFSKTIIILFTTGFTPFPTQAIAQLKSLDVEMRSTLALMIITETARSSVLTQIIENVKPLCQEAQYLHGLSKFSISWGEQFLL